MLTPLRCESMPPNNSAVTLYEGFLYSHFTLRNHAYSRPQMASIATMTTG